MTQTPLPQCAHRTLYESKRYAIEAWEHQLYTGAWKTFERVRLRGSGGVRVIATTPERRILVVRQAQPHWRAPEWTLPGGLIDPGETPLSAAQRELREETGYVSDDWEELRAEPWRGVVYTTTVYIARNCRRVGELTPDAGEQLAVHLRTLDELIALAAWEDFRHETMLRDFLRITLSDEERARWEKRLFGA